MIDQLLQGLSVYLQESFFLAYLAAYLGGILVSFTSCIYPVIPITISFIGARSSGSRWRGFLLSVVYVCGMAATYTVLGSIAALSGQLFGRLQTNPWVYLVMANLCIFMGLAMLEVYLLPIRMPKFISRIQPREQSNGLVSSFLVGAASGLIVGPCTAPVMAVLLAYVATKQNLFFATSLLFVFAFGMGTLLIVLGAFAGLMLNLPKSGPWMTRISHIFGWIMLGAGEYFLIQAGIFWG